MQSLSVPARTAASRVCRAAASSCSRAASSMPPMDVEYGEVPPLRPARTLAEPATEITTLASGLRVASHETYGQISSIGVYVDAGSQYEHGDKVGSGMLLQNLAFHSTESRSLEQLQAFAEQKGIHGSARGDREVITYSVDTLRGSLDEAVELLAESVLEPALTDLEVEEAKHVAEFQLMDLAQRPEEMIQEGLFAAAYGEDSARGRPRLNMLDSMKALERRQLKEYIGQHFTAPRMVVVGAGVDHAELVALVEKNFADVPVEGTEPVSSVAGKYTGGFVSWDLPSDVRPHIKHLSHSSLAFQAPGWLDDDVVPVCVMDTLLGGGSSFSAGGPGKGMYSRLYLSVLAKYGWVDQINAFTLQFADEGLSGLYGAAGHDHIGNMVVLQLMQLEQLATTLATTTELSRARNQLRSSIMMILELRATLAEDIGRQVLLTGKRIDPADLCERIEAVTADDIMRVTRKMFESKPSMVVIGDTSRVPEYSRVEEAISAIIG